MPALPIGIRASASDGGPGRRRGADAALIRLMFVRDRYVCRYCGTRVIDLRVLEALAIATRAYGPIFQRASAWRIAETHPAFWWQSGSNDHVVPRARGGEVNDFENLVTACWPCQHRKSNFTLGELGWKVRPIGPGAPAKGSNLAEWDGLVELLQPLKTLAAATTPKPKEDPRTAIWKRNSRGAYRCPSCWQDPWVDEARTACGESRSGRKRRGIASGSCSSSGRNGSHSPSGLV